MVDRKFGWLEEREDHQFLAATSSPILFSATVIKPRISYRELGMRIEDQLRFGSCGGHAGSTVAEGLNFIDTRQWVQLSRWWAYIAAQREDGINGRDAGCTISGLAKALQSRGICREVSLPYPMDGRYTDRLPQSAAEEALKHRIKSWTRLPTVEQLTQFIGTGLGLVAIGMPWLQGFDEGMISSQRHFGKNLGGHALAVTGYDLKKEILEIPNSWGERMGDRGWFYMTFEFYDKIMRSGNSEGIGMSDLSEYRKPRTFAGIV